MEEDFQDDLLWVEKYRPQTVAECILPDRIKKQFLDFVKQGNMPNLLLSGTAGTGKTTIARALCNDMDYECLLINASKDRNLALIDKISQVASTISLEGRQKAIILDEADGLNPQSAQPALRAAIEEYSHIRFILTCNYRNRLIEPIHSRCNGIDFAILPSEKEAMMLKFLVRTFEILAKEKVTFDKKVVGQLVKKFYPDNRKILGALQGYSAGGTIDAGLLTHAEGATIDNLLKFVKDKDLGACRQWVADNADIDTSTLFSDIYNKFYYEVSPDGVLNMIQAVADYQYKSAFAANQEINTMGLIAALMSNVEFK